MKRAVFCLLMIAMPAQEAWAGFPSTCEIEEFLARARSSPAESSPEATALMTRMFRFAKGEREGWAGLWPWEYFLARWGELFREAREIEMLRAVEAAPSDRAYTTAMCASFHRIVIHDAVAKLFYTANDPRLSGCTTYEVDSYLLGRKASATAPRIQGEGRVTACEVDRLMIRLGSSRPAQRAREIAKIVARAMAHEASNDPGSTYLYSRLWLRFRSAPDAAILSGVDVAAARGLTDGLCYFFSNAATDLATFTNCRVFSEHYKIGTGASILRSCKPVHLLSINACLSK